MTEIEERTKAVQKPLPTAPVVRALRPAPSGPPLPGDPVRNGEALRSSTEGGPEIHAELSGEQHVVDAEGFCLFYGKTQALHEIDMKIPEGKVTALIGPSGCGKSTLLRSLNRLNDLVENVRTEGHIRFRGEPIHGRHVDVIKLRKRMGMVF